MHRILYHLAFVAGLALVGWIGWSATQPLALAVTFVIAAFYLMGALELRRFHDATASLAQALATLPEALPGLEPWLAQVQPALRTAVRQRIEGERIGLPGPALAPYLAGLLVLLGMLGTFLGMVVTLNGTGAALDSATDLQAVRASLSAPVRGLGLAFGTSVAGVAASAMLGLMSALCRRERLQAVQRLDAHIAGPLRVHGAAQRRDEADAQAHELLRRQADALPTLVDRVQDLMAALERRSQALDDGLTARQQHFHGQTEAAYDRLAASVSLALKDSLADSARIAGAALQPVAEATMAAIARETAALQATLGSAVSQQIDGVSRRFEAHTVSVAALWQGALAEHRRAGEAASAALHEAQGRFAESFEQRAAALLRDVTQAQGDLQATLAEQARAQLDHTSAEVARLLDSAAQAPRAAAALMAELREHVQQSLAREHALLEERRHGLDGVAAVLAQVEQAASAQRAAIDRLVAESAELLERVGSRFSDTAQAHAVQMNSVAAQLTGSAVEVASLGEAFGGAVERYAEANGTLVGQLQRVEGALSRSTTRSDEQLAYYVAQAREVIELSLTAQKQILDELQQLARRQAAVTDAA